MNGLHFCVKLAVVLAQPSFLELLLLFHTLALSHLGDSEKRATVKDKGTVKNGETPNVQ